MTLWLYNTLAREKQPFVAADPNRVTLYVCGPTVYNRAHIGNARPAVVFDVLVRLLRAAYPGVVYARNITDVDDKINAAAKARGVDIGVVTAEFTEAYHQDMAALLVSPPDIEPKATAHIPEMIAMIETLLGHGHAYAAEGHVLFHVPGFAEYGGLSGQGRDEMIAGARVEVAPYKRDPADFVLWKPSSPDQPGWDSPWGRGRPGWHLECSAMIEKHLGTTIDIHGGGLDLVFPHHENEIAQSRCVHHGAPLARYWLHNGFLSIDTEKMSKSIGNVLLVRDLLASGVRGEVIRWALLSAQYRQPLDWNDALLAQAKNALDRLYGLLREVADLPAIVAPAPAGFVAALEDDLNTPRAFAELAALARELSTADPAAKVAAKAALLAAGKLLGLLQQDPETWFVAAADDAIDGAAIAALLAEREQARAARDFARADAIREQLRADGVLIDDRPDGAVWRRA